MNGASAGQWEATFCRLDEIRKVNGAQIRGALGVGQDPRGLHPARRRSAPRGVRH